MDIFPSFHQHLAYPSTVCLSVCLRTSQRANQPARQSNQWTMSLQSFSAISELRTSSRLHRRNSRATRLIVSLPGRDYIHRNIADIRPTQPAVIHSGVPEASHLHSLHSAPSPSSSNYYQPTNHSICEWSVTSSNVADQSTIATWNATERMRRIK